MSYLDKVSGQSIPVDVSMVKPPGLLLVSRAQTILDQLKVPHLTEEQIRSIRDPLNSSGDYVCWCHNGAAKTAQQKQRSENGAATAAQRHRRSDSGARTATQRKRHSNNGAVTTAQRQRRSDNGAEKNGAATREQRQGRSWSSECTQNQKTGFSRLSTGPIDTA